MPKPLTAQQNEVLQWIQDGCPNGVYGPGYAHRSVARGLAGRGLVTISGRGPTWSATIREKGRELLATPRAQPAAAEKSEADQLYDRVVASGGRLALGKDADTFDIRRLAEQHLKSPHRPRGKKLTVDGGYYDPTTVTIEDYFDELVEAHPVPVLERVGKYHPLVKEYKQNRDNQRVSPELVQRATLILQALVDEASRRNIKVTRPTTAALAEHRAQREGRAPHLVFEMGGNQYTVGIREVPGPNADRQDYSNQSSRDPAWIRSRAWKFIPTGKLELIVDGRFTKMNGDHYREGKRQRLEEKLPEVFRKLEIYRLELEAAVRKKAFEKAEYERLRAEAIEEAKERYELEQRWQHFTEASAKSREFEEHWGFIAKAMETLESYEGEDKEEILEHLDWAKFNIERIDPAANPKLLLPKVKEPTAADLEQYLPARYQRSRGWY